MKFDCIFSKVVVTNKKLGRKRGNRRTPKENFVFVQANFNRHRMAAQQKLCFDCNRHENEGPCLHSNPRIVYIATHELRWPGIIHDVAT